MLTSSRACRACRAPLQTVLDLGKLALSGFPKGPGDLPRAPLDFCRCTSCGFVQLRHTVDPDVLFRQYWYQSGINEAMRAELADIVRSGIEHLGPLEQGDVVVDVGANDGTLLAACPDGVKRVAYEPAENFQAALRQLCDEQHADYFPGGHLPAPYSVGLLTSIACFYAVDDPRGFVSAVDDALTSRGIWVVQFQDLHQMLEATAFDDICHEHLFYPSLASIERLIASHDLVIIDAEHRPINGGSLRLTIGRHWRRVSPRVATLREVEAGCESLGTLQAFVQRVYDAQAQIRLVLKRHEGQTVDLYGASTKGNTLLQFCGLGPRDVRQAWERSPEKWGRHTVTGIPIVSEDAGRAHPPDVLFVVIWQFREAVIRREEAYLRAGGQLLFPLPLVEVVRGDDVLEGVSARPDSATA